MISNFYLLIYRFPAFDFFDKELISIAILFFFFSQILLNINSFSIILNSRIFSFITIIFSTIVIRELVLNVFNSRDYLVLFFYYLVFIQSLYIAKKYEPEKIIKILYLNLLYFTIFSFLMLFFFPEERYLINLKNNLIPGYEFNFRVLFPGFSTHNVSSITTLLLMQLNFYLLRNKLLKPNFFNTRILYIISLVTIFFTGARASFYIGMFFLVFVAFNKKNLNLRFFVRFWFLLPITQLIFTYFFYISDLFSSIKRETESASDFNRLSIYYATIENVLSDGYFLLFGNGVYSSKVVISQLLSEEGEILTTHNAFLQFFISFGIIGLFWFFYILQKIIQFYSKFKDFIFIPFTILITGFYEASPSFFTFETMFIFIYLCSIMFYSNYTAKLKNAK